MFGTLPGALLGGALVCLLQWPILRHQLRLAVWWIVASALGWSIFFGVGYGVITDLALMLLLRYPPFLIGIMSIVILVLSLAFAAALQVL